MKNDDAALGKDVTYSQVRADFARDERDRPLITDLKSGRLVPYRRTSKYGSVLEDTTFLDAWDRRMVAYGMSHDPALGRAIQELPANHRMWEKRDKDIANAVVDEAKIVAKAGKLAEIGTNLHEITELSDLGLQLPALSTEFESALSHYQRVLKTAGVRVIPDFVECRMVCDQMRAAGTADRIVSYQGEMYIFDVKTGLSSFGGMTYAVQLALYAASLLYDAEAGERLPTPQVSRTRGIICALPSDGSSCELKWVDLVKGFRAAKVAQQVYEFQQERSWYQKLDV